MNLVKWNPWGETEAYEDRIGRIFGNSYVPESWLGDGESQMNWNPAVDVYDNDNSFIIQVELPGLEKKDIEIDVKDGVLTLKGERSSDKEWKDEKYYRRERAFGKFQRAFKLPSDIDPEKVKADFKNGVLKIEIPKPEIQKPKKITVH